MTRTGLIVQLFGIGLVLGACADVQPPPVGLRSPDAGPTAPWPDAGRTPQADDSAPPQIEILNVAEQGLRARVVGTAHDDRQVTTVEVRVGHSGPYPATLQRVVAAPDRWSVDVPLPPTGPVDVVAHAFDGSGHRAQAVWTIVRPNPPPAVPPELRVDAPDDGAQTHAPSIVFRGTTSDPLGVVQVEVNGEQAFFGAAQTLDHFAHWTKTVPLRPGATERFSVVATNAAGQRTVEHRTVISRAVPPHGPPVIEATDPADGAVVPGPVVQLRAVVRPAETQRPGAGPEQVAVAAVEARVDEGPWRLAEAGPDDVWTLDLAVPGPAHQIEILARDVDGLEASATIAVRSDARWGDGPEVRLRPPGPPGGAVVLDLDRAGLAALFGAEAASVEVLRVELAPLFAAALRTVRGACGPGWAAAGFEPECPADWGPEEHALWAALSRTPANTAWGETSVGLAAVTADAIVPEGFAPVIAAALGVADPEDPLLPADALAAQLVARVVAAHPHAEGGVLTLTLADALTDLAGLSDRLGPAGAHPGLFGANTRGAIFSEALRVQLHIDSNLRVFEGVDLAASRRAYFGAPAAGEPAAELDFADPDRFVVAGLAEAPSVTVDLALATAGPAPSPADSPLDGPRSGEVWGRAPWGFEGVAAAATEALRGAHRFGCDLCAGPEAGAALWRDASGRVDLLEVAVGRLGYDCADDAPCPRPRPTPLGEAEHFVRYDHLDCERRADCAAGEVCARSGRDDDRGRCVAQAALRCMRDADCVEGACLAGACVPAEEIVCRADLDCANQAVCHQGQCRDVPAGWLRLWVAGDGHLAPPLFIWDLVAEAVSPPEAAGARFTVPELALPFDAATLEAALRERLHEQRARIAELLLGALPAQGQRVDLYLDRGADGAVWLLVSGCGVDGQPCDGPSEGQLVDAAQQAAGLVGPGGRVGLPLAMLAPGQTWYLRREQRIDRVDVLQVDPAAEEVTLWLRPRE